MEKVKLTDARKKRGYSQSYMAEKLFMDVSNYNRREKGQARITSEEWQRLSDILEMPVEDIFESEDTQIFICKDNATGNYWGTNHINYSIPEHLLETQRKYIEKLESEIAELKRQLAQAGS